MLFNIGDDTIGFGTFHKFRDGEEVIYKTFGGALVSQVLLQHCDSKYS